MVHAEDVSFQTDYEYIPDDIEDTSSGKLEPEKTISDANVQHNLQDMKVQKSVKKLSEIHKIWSVYFQIGIFLDT